MQSWCQQLLWKVIILLEVIFWPRFKHLFKFKFFTEVTPPPPPLLFNPGISEDLVLPSVKKGVFPFTCFGKSFRDTKKKDKTFWLCCQKHSLTISSSHSFHSQTVYRLELNRYWIQERLLRSQIHYLQRRSALKTKSDAITVCIHCDGHRIEKFQLFRMQQHWDNN